MSDVKKSELQDRMARNDHYVSQTYLKAFTGSTGDIVPYYKNARVVVGNPKKPKSICFESEGDSSKYLRDPRLIDEFLPRFENPWKSSVANVENGKLDPDTRFDLCGYMAYLQACTPTAKRLGQSIIAASIEPMARWCMMQEVNKSTEISAELKTYRTRMVRGGQVRLKIDREFAHAQAVAHLFGLLCRLYCSRWLIMVNDSDIPFIASDNPAVFSRANGGQQVADIYVPLTPRAGVLISPDLSITRPDLDTVKKYNCAGKTAFGLMKPSCVMGFNEAVVKNAERLVLHREDVIWLKKLVHKYRSWRAEAMVSRLPTKGGVFVHVSIQAVNTRKSEIRRMFH